MSPPIPMWDSDCGTQTRSRPSLPFCSSKFDDDFPMKFRSWGARVVSKDASPEWFWRLCFVLSAAVSTFGISPSAGINVSADAPHLDIGSIALILKVLRLHGCGSFSPGAVTMPKMMLSHQSGDVECVMHNDQHHHDNDGFGLNNPRIWDACPHQNYRAIKIVFLLAHGHPSNVRMTGQQGTKTCLPITIPQWELVCNILSRKFILFLFAPLATTWREKATLQHSKWSRRLSLALIKVSMSFSCYGWGNRGNKDNQAGQQGDSNGGSRAAEAKLEMVVRSQDELSDSVETVNTDSKRKVIQEQKFKQTLWRKATVVNTATRVALSTHEAVSKLWFPKAAGIGG